MAEVSQAAVIATRGMNHRAASSKAMTVKGRTRMNFRMRIERRYAKAARCSFVNMVDQGSPWGEGRCSADPPAPTKILIKLPSRQRPDVLVEAVHLYALYAEDKDRTRMVVTLDRCDRSFTNAHAEKLRGMPIRVEVERMERVSKIAAVNYGLSSRPWDVVLVASDDMWPIMKGYDGAIRDEMQARFPDGDGCLWFHDGCQSRLCTLPVMGRKYFDRTGRVYDERFMSYKADDLMQDEANELGRMSPMLGCIIKHEHWYHGGAMPKDALYRHNMQHRAEDYRTYALIRSQGLGSGKVL
jgi:hypothetical protein